MRIVDASYEIIEPELRSLTIHQRLETCGRICYKSEDRITESSAIPFCMKMVENKHMSTMEMAVLHFHLNYYTRTALDGLKQFKYLKVTGLKDSIIVSGSMRAFLELIFKVNNSVIYLIGKALFSEFPELINFEFPTIDCSRYAVRLSSNSDLIPYEHQHIAVRFIVNRAVTHELVRHRPVTYLQESQRYCNYGSGKFNKEVTFINPKAFFDKETVDYDIWYKACQLAELNYLRLLDNMNSPQAARTVLPNSCKTEIIVYTDTKEWEHIFSLRTTPAAEPSMREVMIPLQEEMIERGFIKA